MKRYKDKFFADRDARTRYAANTVLDLVLRLLPDVRSVVDAGCGVGTWLSVAREKGVKEIYGLDGRWVRPELLAIPAECFTAVDFKRTLSLPARYDLAISLEVAEHLPPECALTFVESLTNLADVVLFSAAVPHQGGRNHVNEHWPDYWAHLFSTRGYEALDVIRSRIWNDPKINYWYRQNTVLYVKQARLPSLKLTGGLLAPSGSAPLNVVHPELYLSKNPMSLAAGWKMFRRGLRASLRRTFGRRASRPL